ncbi:MAG: T9SS type A sorting domain-containing protein [Williamsia sp.]|nr:T9SS type A sorting domain-containing protein [Williamsia sp.]
MKKIYLLLFSAALLSVPAFSQTVHVVNTSNFAFAPNNIQTVKVGDTIRFTRVNGTHTTTSTNIPAGAASWDQPLNATSLVYNYVVTVPGTYDYICVPHEALGMVGQFVVQSVAPVKMTNLASVLVEGKAKISWQTASEENADHFSIQQSIDGINFTEIGTVAAAGNSQSLLKYSYTVNNVPGSAAYLYFRVLTVDKDGKQQYSSIILLHLPKAGEANFVKKMYPNPASNGDHVHFDFNAENNGLLDITIFETTGRKLFSMPITAVEGANQTHMPLPKLRKGSYFVQFSLEGKKQTLPLFIQ